MSLKTNTGPFSGGTTGWGLKLSYPIPWWILTECRLRRECRREILSGPVLPVALKPFRQSTASWICTASKPNGLPGVIVAYGQAMSVSNAASALHVMPQGF